MTELNACLPAHIAAVDLDSMSLILARWGGGGRDAACRGLSVSSATAGLVGRLGSLTSLRTLELRCGPAPAYRHVE